ncbi:MAG: hypothetical protein WAU89_01555 [Candidatus Acidiferrales bacterium]
MFEKVNAQCESVCLEDRCQLKLGHHGKHRFEGSSWTDGGVERLKREQEAQQKFIQQ